MRAVALLLVLSCASVAFGEVAGGRVTDGAAPIPRARVLVFDTGSGQYFEDRTDFAGRWAVQVPAGTWRVGAFVVLPLAALVEQRGWGLLNVLRLPAWASLPLGLLALDYTLWHWHRLNHRVPILWRFHAAHHADLEMDASTALRFHFGEVALGIGWIVLQVVALGIGPRTLAIFSVLLMASVLFHHSNVRLPERFERRLVTLVTTPRMHGIHHSVVPAETNSNYASLLTAWDVFHGTLRLDVPQETITIGVREWRDPRELTILGVQMLPFRKSKLASSRVSLDGG